LQSRSGLRFIPRALPRSAEHRSLSPTPTGDHLNGALRAACRTNQGGGVPNFTATKVATSCSRKFSPKKSRHQHNVRTRNQRIVVATAVRYGAVPKPVPKPGERSTVCRPYPYQIACGELCCCTWAYGTPAELCERSRDSWGSSGRRFKSCQPDQSFSSLEAVSGKSGAAFFVPGGGMYGYARARRISSGAFFAFGTLLRLARAGPRHTRWR
jgi:hypothetical protein